MNRRRIFITSFVILLPVIVGAFIWNKLPENIPVHWDFEGNPDGYWCKSVAVFFNPIFMLLVHLFCIMMTYDVSIVAKRFRWLKKGKVDLNSKIMCVVLWICPVLSVLCTSVSYAVALGFDVRVEFIIPLFMGVLFLILGNYLPKCKQNYTVGIKIPWTLNDEENWNRTHRFAGIVWTVCAIVVIIGAFFERAVVYTTFIPISIMVFAPMIYSYVFYRNHKDSKR